MEFNPKAVCSIPGLGFNGVVIDLQQHFETYPNYQILPKFTSKIYDNVADFRQLRAVESQPWNDIEER